MALGQGRPPAKRRVSGGVPGANCVPAVRGRFLSCWMTWRQTAVPYSRCCKCQRQEWSQAGGSSTVNCTFYTVAGLQLPVGNPVSESETVVIPAVCFCCPYFSDDRILFPTCPSKHRTRVAPTQALKQVRPGQIEPSRSPRTIGTPLGRIRSLHTPSDGPQREQGGASASPSLAPKKLNFCCRFPDLPNSHCSHNTSPLPLKIRLNPTACVKLTFITLSSPPAFDLYHPTRHLPPKHTFHL
jgi:hypothetical protein